LSSTVVCRADDTIPLKTLNAIKNATVFVKLDAGPLSASGSGFVLKTENQTGYIITNDHVVTPPTRPGLRRPAATAVSVVFRSGTAQELVCPAEVVANDPDRDLAVLKVTDVKDLPAPIDRGKAPDLVETTAVYICGFPFGRALSTGKR